MGPKKSRKSKKVKIQTLNTTNSNLPTLQNTKSYKKIVILVISVIGAIASIIGIFDYFYNNMGIIGHPYRWYYKSKLERSLIDNNFSEMTNLLNKIERLPLLREEYHYYCGIVSVFRPEAEFLGPCQHFQKISVNSSYYFKSITYHLFYLSRIADPDKRTQEVNCFQQVRLNSDMHNVYYYLSEIFRNANILVSGQDQLEIRIKLDYNAWKALHQKFVSNFSDSVSFNQYPFLFFDVDNSEKTSKILVSVNQLVGITAVEGLLQYLMALATEKNQLPYNIEEHVKRLRIMLSFKEGDPVSIFSKPSIPVNRKICRGGTISADLKSSLKVYQAGAFLKDMERISYIQQ